MKIQQNNQSIQNERFTIINAKTIQIKKVVTLHDMMELKSKFSSIKKAVLIGEKIYVERPTEIPLTKK